MNRKQSNRATLREAIRDEIASMYGNARIAWPRFETPPGCAELFDFLGEYARDVCELGMRDDPGFDLLRFGPIYSYGRNGKTFAPDKLVSGGVYWRLIEDFADDFSYATACDFLQWLRAFNRYIRACAANVPAAYARDCLITLDDDRDNARQHLADCRREYGTLARELRPLRGNIATPTACRILREKMARLVAEAREAAATLRAANAAASELEPFAE